MPELSVGWMDERVRSLRPEQKSWHTANPDDGCVWAVMSVPAETSRILPQRHHHHWDQFPVEGIAFTTGNSLAVAGTRSGPWLRYGQSAHFKESDGKSAEGSILWQIRSIYGSCGKLGTILWKTILENLDLPYNVSLAKDENYLANAAQWYVLGKSL